MKKTILTTVLIILCIKVFSQTADLTITFKGLENLKGNIEVGLYKNSKSFPKVGKDDISAVVPVKSNEFTYTVKNVPLGEYSIACFHDENEDGKHNTNIIGIPKEGYGFSNNKFGPYGSSPKFEDALIKLDSNMTITIILTQM